MAVEEAPLLPMGEKWALSRMRRKIFAYANEKRREGDYD